MSQFAAALNPSTPFYDTQQPQGFRWESQDGVEEVEAAPSDSSEYSSSPDALQRRASRINSHGAMNDFDARELQRIVKTLSRRQSQGPDEEDLAPTLSRLNTLGATNEYNAALDPQSDSFDLRKWLQNFIDQLDSEGFSRTDAGLVFKDFGVSGSGEALQLQQTVGSILSAPARLGEFFSFGKKSHKQILRNFNGLLRSGELLIVLGRPGSGCSTLLKSMCGELHGLSLDEKSVIHYNGIPQEQMKKEFLGEAVYNQEVCSIPRCDYHILITISQVDKHFPQLTVGQTLEFAAALRTPSHRIQGISRDEWSKLVAQVVMAMFSLTHTYSTKVGNDFIRGVSGGERKRVSIAEMIVAGSPISAWDNRYVSFEIVVIAY
jgi:ATP-binding cassette, subfamily G (WHITE), member 2, PDR